ncbi:type II toxin-antitoxin system HicB family antitoxin [Mycobacterium sp. MYCO198283]|uniref:toxin-antitoxin system HicB family antitoxin n=1 Tax=Mycobacterium sp. MYCO198283 TaxID=2883505 RepID=UPI001E531EA6|nr:toxin-antitoxin system HicB family antitoxin [Mycobacterium sp. MYCO198283]MCG5431561.1 type II toxin-antitoxin system HicB family antitoxin [Mycobacterium sp. MYCO198283]
MDLQPYVDRVTHELAAAAAVGGDDMIALAERLSAPLQSAIRLAILEALTAGAEDVTRALAPVSVEVRLRGLDAEFVVVDAPTDAEPEPPAPPVAAEDGGTWRVTLRLPETVRPRIEAAARSEGISLNAWLVRAATAAAAQGGATSSRTATRQLRGWVH